MSANRLSKVEYAITNRARKMSDSELLEAYFAAREESERCESSIMFESAYFDIEDAREQKLRELHATLEADILAKECVRRELIELPEEALI